MTPAAQTEHPEARFVQQTIAQGLIPWNGVDGDAGWAQPMDPADPRFVLHRVTAELIEKYPHLNDSYLGAPVEGHPGWFHALPEDPTFAGWVCGHYLTAHKPTAYKIREFDPHGTGRKGWEVRIWDSSSKEGPAVFSAATEAEADALLAKHSRGYYKVFREVDGQILKVWIPAEEARAV